MYMSFFSNSDKSYNSDTDASQGILFVKATTYRQVFTDFDIKFISSMLLLIDLSGHIYDIILLPL